jgi:hypothetical protein
MKRNHSDAYHRKGKQALVYKLDGTDKLTDVFDRISVTRSVSCTNANVSLHKLLFNMQSGFILDST